MRCNKCGLLECPCQQGSETKSGSGLPGTELRKIIPRILKPKDCKCADVAAWMDKIGPEGCIRNFQKIVDHLVKQAESSLIGSVTTRAMRESQAKKWLQEAIMRAES